MGWGGSFIKTEHVGVKAKARDAWPSPRGAERVDTGRRWDSAGCVAGATPRTWAWRSPSGCVPCPRVSPHGLPRASRPRPRQVLARPRRLRLVLRLTAGGETHVTPRGHFQGRELELLRSFRVSVPDSGSS